MTDLLPILTGAFGASRVRCEVPLRDFTTFKVGGPAQWLLETQGSDELVQALRLAHAAGVPVTLLGGGSNVLVADAGVRGLVIRPRGGQVVRVDASRVRVDAAMTINGFVRWTITHGVAGVEEWAGTPGTVGGAVYGNAHFGGRLISELIAGVRLCTRDGTVSEVPTREMGFGYDRSRLQTTGEVLLSADFIVTDGEPDRLREVARRSLAYRKRTQPLEKPSAGCIFQNPMPESDVVPAGIPWSAGALVDRAGFKGVMLGGARVSPVHGNFIVNEGGATAADIRRLIEQCRAAVREQFGVELRDEIVYLGEFDL
ncbi:MAG: UDP-N-acetylmuramate dehydrogenase [Vicinamibacterales bacterium]